MSTPPPPPHPSQMVRIVPADVASGDEWGSDAEGDARDYGRFRRIANSGPETIRIAFKLYPPRNARTRERIYSGLGLGPPPAGDGGRGGEKGDGGGGGDGGNGGDNGEGEDSGGGDGGVEGGGGGKVGVGAGKGVSGVRPAAGSAPRGSKGRGDGGEGDVAAAAAATATSLPTTSTARPKPRKSGKNDEALLASHGIKRPKGKHPGYIVTLYGKKVCPVCQCWFGLEVLV